MRLPRGVLTALVTPFKGGELDITSYRRVLRQQLSQGVDGFVVNGTTGESPTLKFDEVRELFAVAREEAGPDKTLLLGTGSNSTAATVAFTKEVAAWKPDGFLVVVPYYNRPPQRGLVAHFLAVAEASSVPVTLYNVPSRTVASLEPQTVAELSRHPRIVAIKEASGDIAMLKRLKELCQKDFVFLSGDDATCVDFAAAGGHGVIGVASHIIGKEMGLAMKHAISDDHGAGAVYRNKYATLMRLLYVEANPIPVKMALNIMGWIASPELRLPLMELDAKYYKDLKTCLEDLNKI